METSFSTNYRKKETLKKPILTGHDPEENKRLFKLYIEPHIDMVKSLVFKYSNYHAREDIDNDLYYVLNEFYKYIYSYNPQSSLKTWIHIVTKRTVQELNFKRYKHSCHYTTTPSFSLSIATNDNLLYEDNYFKNDDFTMNLSDDIASVINELPPLKLSAFLLQLQGLSIKEITDIEYARHHLYKYSLETIKSRIFFCRNYLRGKITRDGKLRNSKNK